MSTVSGVNTLSFTADPTRKEGPPLPPDRLSLVCLNLYGNEMA